MLTCFLCILVFAQFCLESILGATQISQDGWFVTLCSVLKARGMLAQHMGRC